MIDCLFPYLMGSFFRGQGVLLLVKKESGRKPCVGRPSVAETTKSQLFSSEK